LKGITIDRLASGADTTRLAFLRRRSVAPGARRELQVLLIKFAYSAGERHVHIGKKSRGSAAIFRE